MRCAYVLTDHARSARTVYTPRVLSWQLCRWLLQAFNRCAGGASRTHVVRLVKRRH